MNEETKLQDIESETKAFCKLISLAYIQSNLFAKPLFWKWDFALTFLFYQLYNDSKIIKTSITSISHHENNHQEN